MKLSVSFKNNKMEQKIYNHIMEKLNYSVYIKELVLEDMKRTDSYEEIREVKCKQSESSMQVEW